MSDREAEPAPERAQTGSRAALISNRMVQLMSRYTGRGPTRTRSALNTNFVMVTFNDTLTKGERNLVEAGEIQTVYAMRRSYHELMRADAMAAVSEILDREVLSFLSDVDPRANVAVLIFLLAPVPESGQLESAEI